tara:strand:+ start:24 stop:575 length:552 start_codon:yes stop_codon:yes gene_type:complete
MAMTLITTETASSSASLAFTASIDNTYKLYIFKFYDIHPSDSGVYLTWQGSTDGGSNYNIQCTTTMFRSSHAEDDSGTPTINYDSGSDAAQSSSYINIDGQMANANDHATAGEIFLFNPSSTTYVKHWYSIGNVMTHHADPAARTMVHYTSGYFNTTDNIDAVSFMMQSGNIDAGTIKMYGVG